ncbi:MAG: hypothetical protein ACYTEQ_22740 [Planctomycetota bacterium]|jgi:hypothetical protein
MSINTKRPKVCKSPGCLRFVHRAHREKCHDCARRDEEQRELIAELLDEQGRVIGTTPVYAVYDWDDDDAVN